MQSFPHLCSKFPSGFLSPSGQRPNSHDSMLSTFKPSLTLPSFSLPESVYYSNTDSAYSRTCQALSCHIIFVLFPPPGMFFLHITFAPASPPWPFYLNTTFLMMPTQLPWILFSQLTGCYLPYFFHNIYNLIVCYITNGFIFIIYCIIYHTIFTLCPSRMLNTKMVWSFFTKRFKVCRRVLAHS